jgi:hypothetical protein
MSRDLEPAKLAAFLTEYEALCRRHGLRLTPELYDLLQVWPLSMRQDEDPLERVDDAYLAVLRPAAGGYQPLPGPAIVKPPPRKP